jgi:thiamine biosynthesis lipoprotein
MSVQNPFEEGVVASFKMKDMAISTSGNYRRYVKSSKYNHLINPKTRACQSRFASITLISNVYSNSDLDAYATASSVMPYTKAIAFLNEMKLGYLLIRTDKAVLVNEVFRRSVQDLKLFSLEERLKKEYIKALPLTFQSSKKLSL